MSLFIDVYLRIMIDLIFYFFAAMVLLSSSFAILASNPIYTVLSLIASFLSASCLFFMIGAEYLGATMVIVYVGAVAVLFLFVVMMLDNKKEIKPSKPINKIKFSIYTCATIILLYFLITALYKPVSIAPETTNSNFNKANTLSLGKLLYTDYIIPFELSSLLLLLSIIGAIVLTLQHKSSSKKQNISEQINRKRTINLVNPPTKKGVKL